MIQDKTNNLITVLVVDDEEDIRKGIAYMIDWNSMGFSIIGEASNGSEALNLIRKQHPAVVITDIRMPGMDGMQLIEILHEEFPETKVVLLSGYSDIEYYRKALSFMIFDYILKPSNPDEFTKILIRLRNSIYKEKQSKRSMVLAGELFLNRMLTSEYTDEYIESQLDSLDIKLSGPPFHLAIITGKTRSLKTIQLENMLTFRGIDNQFFMLLSGCSKQETEAYIQEFIEEYAQSERLYVSISPEFSTLEKIGQAYNQVLITAKEHMLFPEIPTLWYQDLSSSKFQIGGKQIPAINMIVNDVIRNDADAIKEDLNSAFEDILKAKDAGFNRLDYLCTAIYYQCLEKALWLGLYIPPVSELYDFLTRISSTEEIRNRMESILLMLSENFHQYSSSNKEKVVRDINQIIDEEYQNPQMSLTYISSRIKKSEAYISSLYKAETGQTILSRITQLRLDQAKKLLRSTTMKTYRIAEQVGYTDCSYFSKLFRKTTGMTPLEFRSNSR